MGAITTAILASAAIAQGIQSQQQAKSASKAASKQRKLAANMVPKEAEPPPVREDEEGRVGLKRRQKKSGRAQTILAGDLVPNTGMKTLLG